MSSSLCCPTHTLKGINDKAVQNKQVHKYCLLSVSFYGRYTISCLEQSLRPRGGHVLIGDERTRWNGSMPLSTIIMPD